MRYPEYISEFIARVLSAYTAPYLLPPAEILSKTSRSERGPSAEKSNETQRAGENFVKKKWCRNDVP